MATRESGRPSQGATGLELGPEASEKLAEATRRHGIRLLVAFGSHVTGRTHRASDLDVAVVLEGADEADTVELWADLQAAFPGREVDIVWLHRSCPLLAWEALRRARLLVGDPRDLVRYRTYAWRRFVEYAPFFELEARSVRRRLARYRDGRR